jgi:hypothetical protein
LCERTEGNPFFLEESVQTLVETQVLSGKPEGYRLAAPLPSLQVPTTVQAVLAGRIDRLPPEEEETVVFLSNETFSMNSRPRPLTPMWASSGVQKMLLIERTGHRLLCKQLDPFVRG